jgi:CPA1 family monovalent cation:H+ antiporter
MHTFELTLLLLVGAVALSAVARRFGLPSPALLALGGSALALLPNGPQIHLDPELALALFVAPVLLDAAYDTSLRDLRRNWIPVTCLVLIAVGFTTAAVAWLVHALVPGIPWAAAIALGAIVAPPDAAAASAVLKQLRLPHRVLVILEGESLLNDASALLIYRLAVTASVGGITAADVAPAFALGVIGSIIVGYLLARVNSWILSYVEDASSSIVLQFVGTFGVWIVSERLGLSSIVTVVVFAVTAARRSGGNSAARLRLPSYAVWDTVVFVLNVLAFVLIGLQLRPILEALEPYQRTSYLEVAAYVLIMVIAVRILWVMLYNTAGRFKAQWFGGGRWPGEKPPTVKGGILISWCGMRGIVTLAAAYALPTNFPYRELIVLCAFCVVVGTLVLQGLTLRPLITWLHMKDERPVENEVRQARIRLAEVALKVLDGDTSPEAKTLRREFGSVLEGADGDEFDGRTAHDALRARIIDEQRRVLVQLRNELEIGDNAFHQIEEQLDLAEVNAKGMASS